MAEKNYKEIVEQTIDNYILTNLLDYKLNGGYIIELNDEVN